MVTMGIALIKVLHYSLLLLPCGKAWPSGNGKSCPGGNGKAWPSRKALPSGNALGW